MRGRSPRATARTTTSCTSSPTRSSCCRGSSGITASRSPTAPRSRASTWRSSRAQHVTVALNGDGGDESFAGYNRYGGVRLADRVAGFPASARALAAHRVESCRKRQQRERLPLEAAAARKLLFSARARSVLDVDGLLHRGRAASACTRRRPGHACASGTAPSVISDAWLGSRRPRRVNRLLDVDVQTYLPGDLLVKMDIASMAYSLEVRSPLLDHEFMELCAGFPGSWKLSGFTHEEAVQGRAAPVAPGPSPRAARSGASACRSRRGSAAHFAIFRARSCWTRGRVARGLFREQYVRDLIDQHLAGTQDNSSRIWALIQLELWFRTFVDSRMDRPLDVGFALAA